MTSDAPPPPVAAVDEVLPAIALWRVDDLGGAGIVDPVAALVLGPPRGVEHLLVGGRLVVEDGELRTADPETGTAELRRVSRRQAAYV
jgi:hypothetical protein